MGPLTPCPCNHSIRQAVSVEDGTGDFFRTSLSLACCIPTVNRWPYSAVWTSKSGLLCEHLHPPASTCHWNGAQMFPLHLIISFYTCQGLTLWWVMLKLRFQLLSLFCQSFLPHAWIYEYMPAGNNNVSLKLQVYPNLKHSVSTPRLFIQLWAVSHYRFIQYSCFCNDHNLSGCLKHKTWCSSNTNCCHITNNSTALSTCLGSYPGHQHTSRAIAIIFNLPMAFVSTSKFNLLYKCSSQHKGGSIPITLTH